MYHHLPHDDNATDSGADVTFDHHSQLYSVACGGPILMRLIQVPTSPLVYNFVRAQDLPV